MNSTQDRALALLGQGLKANIVAATLGVEDSYISQLLSQDDFAKKVAEARYENLAAHTVRDNKYDSLEDQILEKLSASLEMIFDPMKLAKLLQIINGAKRRGTGVQELPQTQAPTLSLVIPIQVVQHFSKNSLGQVVQAGEQNLVTIQSGNMVKLAGQLANQTEVLNVPTPNQGRIEAAKVA